MRIKQKTRIFAPIVAAAAIIAGGVFAINFAGANANAVTVTCTATDRDTLQACLNLGTSGDTVDITVASDFTIGQPAPVTVSGQCRYFTIHSDGTQRTISRAADFPGILLALQTNAMNCTTYEIKDITIDGNRNNVTAMTPLIAVGTYVKSLTLSGNTSIQNNNNNSNNGGGIQLSDFASLIMTDNAQIVNNRTSQSGGGVYANVGQVMSITLSKNAKINDNFAGSNGGGIFSSQTVFTMSDSAEINNNEAGNTGGGAWIVATTADISGSASVSDNRAGSSAAGIYFAQLTSGATVINASGNATFDNNTAPWGGGAWMIVDKVDIHITGNVSFTNNYGGYGGGAIYMSQYQFSDLWIDENVKFAGNTADRFETFVYPHDQAVYDTNVKATQWSNGATNGYNNYDILYYVPRNRVVFDSEGGSAVPAQNVVDGLTVAKPADPTRAGYRFAGWYVGVDCTIEGWWFYNDEAGTYEFQAEKPANADDPDFDGWQDYGCLVSATDTAWDFNWIVPENVYDLPQFQIGVPSDFGMPDMDYIVRLYAKWEPACQYDNALDPDDPKCVAPSEPGNPGNPTAPIIPGAPNTGLHGRFI